MVKKMPNNAMSLPNQKQIYQKMVTASAPKPRILRNVFWAFIVGGSICLIGQFILSAFLIRGFGVSEAAAMTSTILILLAAFLTGIGVYDEISRFAGAGGIVPITGFANSMVSSALEFRSEGLVIGVGARLFTVAGPVLVWGIVTAWVIGVIYYFILRSTGHMG